MHTRAQNTCFPSRRPNARPPRVSRLSSLISHRSLAFTLTELIVAVGLVTLLMIGVTQIFKFAGDSVSTGQALSSNLRDGRSAQDVFSRDITAMAKDSPAIIIRSRVRAAFRNRADQLGDRDYAAAGNDTQRLAAKLTLDINNDGTEGDPGVLGERVTFFDVNSRMHRLDDFSFFARDLYRRQTANSGRFIANQSSYEAWVHYGHLVLPHSNGQFYLDGATGGTKTNPGAGTELSNPQNFYANQWILGRVAVLLVEPESGTSGVTGVIRDSGGNPQAHWYRAANPDPTSLSPLASGGGMQRPQFERQVRRAAADQVVGRMVVRIGEAGEAPHAA
ncbi:MAG TPA: hypothetical protein PKB10_11450, partial [Tepidisphaeraceae bacterium]|nr:hypothetical protein [Tepidisphaeraceae bacterium]